MADAGWLERSRRAPDCCPSRPPCAAQRRSFTSTSPRKRCDHSSGCCQSTVKVHFNTQALRAEACRRACVFPVRQIAASLPTIAPASPQALRDSLMHQRQFTDPKAEAPRWCSPSLGFGSSVSAVCNRFSPRTYTAKSSAHHWPQRKALLRSSSQPMASQSKDDLRYLQGRFAIDHFRA